MTHFTFKINQISLTFFKYQIPLLKKQSPTFLWYDTDRIENDEYNNFSFVACVFFAAVTVFFLAFA
jgi:hypothetical protein